MSGWVKFHRKIEDWEWYSDANTFRLFFHLITKANHKDRKWMGETVKRGQHITSIDNLSNELKLSPQQIRTAINKLKSTSEITIKSTNRFTLVTVENYSVYQSECDESTNEPTNDSTFNQQTDNKRITTNKNVKELENEKEVKHMSVFDAWQSEKIHIHKGVNKSIEQQLNKLTAHQAEEVIAAIKNYSKAYRDQSYYYNNVWTLDAFIKQSNGYKQWLDEGKLWVDYNSRNEVKKPAYKRETIS